MSQIGIAFVVLAVAISLVSVIYGLWFNHLNLSLKEMNKETQKDFTDLRQKHIKNLRLIKENETQIEILKKTRPSLTTNEKIYLEGVLDNIKKERKDLALVKHKEEGEASSVTLYDLSYDRNYLRFRVLEFKAPHAFHGLAEDYLYTLKELGLK